ncbi:hypothetical protein EV363DRAFT_218902 [Boletus edulis]|nr:hypothetical protein EV363DRAFT_218902 [Boletus edulis]
MQNFMPSNINSRRISCLGVTVPDSKPNVVVDRSAGRASACNTSCQQHPRYYIRAYQCSHETWGVIHPDDVACYNQLLCLDGLLADHPRQDSDSLQLTRQSLPVWYRVPVWMTGEEDNGDNADDKPENVIQPGQNSMEL